MDWIAGNSGAHGHMDRHSSRRSFIRRRANARVEDASAPITRASELLSLFDQEPPFSFRYDDTVSAALLPRWSHTHQRNVLDSARTEHTIGWVDPGTQLHIRCVLIEYHDLATIDWTLYFKNAGNAPTPVVTRFWHSI